MAKIGYVMNYAGYGADTDKEWMKRFGCVRKSSDAIRKVKSRMRTLSPVDYNRIGRKECVVNMYKSGHLINEIWKASGFRSRSSVFRVLKEAGIVLNRGRKKG